MARRSLVLFACLGLFYWFAGLPGQPVNAGHENVPPQSSKPLLLIGGTIITQTDEGTVSGYIVIHNGQIKEISRATRWSGDYEVIDITGCIVTPGLMDARSVLRLNAGAAREGSRDGSLDVLDGVDPFSEDWIDAAAQGITSVGVQPGPTGLLSGVGAVLAVTPGIDPNDWIIKKEAWVQASLGVGQGSANALQRQGLYLQLRGQLEAAKQYSTSKPTRKDPTLEKLARVIKGEIPLRLEAHYEDDIRNALKLQEDFKIRIILEGVSEPRLTAATLSERRTPLLLGPFGSGSIWGSQQRSRDAQWPKCLLTHSSRWILGTFGLRPEATHLLRAQAALAVANGIPPEQVLKAMTLYPAELLGVGDRLGQIAVGRTADLAVFAGDPLDPSTPVRLTIAQGKITYRPKQTAVARHGSTMASNRATIQLPDPLPTRFVLKSSRMLNDQGRFAPGNLAIENGKIISRQPAPGQVSGWPVYDCGDAPITPGLFAANFSLPNVSEDSDAHMSQLRAVDEFDPHADWVRTMQAHGFLHVAISPSMGQVLSGQVGLVRLGSKPQVVQNDLGQQVVLTGSARNVNRFPSSLSSQIDLVATALQGQLPDLQLYLPAPIQAKLLEQQKASMQALLDRKQTAFFVVDSRPEIDAALSLARTFKLKSVIVEPLEVKHNDWQADPAHISVILGPKQWVQSPVEWQQWVAHTKWPLAFGMGSGEELRLLAALAVQAGLPPEKALIGLTQGPGPLLGLPADFGQLQEGGAADCVIWTGSPLNLQARPVCVIAQGQRVKRPK